MSITIEVNLSMKSYIIHFDINLYLQEFLEKACMIIAFVETANNFNEEKGYVCYHLIELIIMVLMILLYCTTCKLC